MNNDCTLQSLTCVDHNLGVSSCHTRDYVISPWTCYVIYCSYLLPAYIRQIKITNGGKIDVYIPSDRASCEL